MTQASNTRRGQVWVHTGQAFGRTEYGVAVVGAGLIGTAAAYYLRQFRPELQVLLLDEGGLPSEDGATLQGAGVWCAEGLEGAELRQAEGTRRELETLLGSALQSRPLLNFGAEGKEATAGALADFPALHHWLNAEALPCVTRHETLSYRAGELALRLGQQAVAAGADLMLNTRAELTEGGLCLRRLSVTNRHEIVVAETHTVRVGHTVVAAGAAGPALLEDGLGLHTPHGKAYVQRPRLRLASDVASPLVQVGDLLLRPLQGEYAVYLPPKSADPHGYAPTSGRLSGVQVGLRRELLQDLLPRMQALPVLASEALGVGKSVSEVAGAWLALPYGDRTHGPIAEAVAQGVTLLLGGASVRGVDTLGLGLVREWAEGCELT